jgi:hypothetical protein
MARAPARKLNIDYMVIKCSAPTGLVCLGILGTLTIRPKLGLLFFVGNSPKSIQGLDAFEMKLISATPNAIQDDLNQLTSQNIPPNKLLEEVSSRYRGTIFASERTLKEIPTTITAATGPQQILSEVVGAIMQLAKQEKVTLQMTRKSRRRHTTKKSARARTGKTTRRQVGIPRQFGLTTLQI